MPIRDHNPSGTLPIVTLSIIVICVFVFLYEISLPEREFINFLSRFALIPSTVDFSQPGTLIPFITSIFLHGGVLHIASNMLFLWVFGDNIEAALGKVKFLIFYLLGGVIASFVQYLFISNASVPMLGASGSIAAILGSYLILYPNARIDVLIPIFYIPALIPVPAFLMLIYWFITQILSGTLSLGVETESTGGVAFFAHIGGFLAGIFLINLFGPKRL
jgi:membrane associated rhomboid family serine protease